MKKKTVKRLLSASMVTVMTVGLLAGCGSSGGSDDSEGGSGDGKTLKVAAFEGGNGADIWEKIAAAFEEEYENEAETINTTMQNNAFYEQVQKWADEYGIKVTVNDEVLDKIN